MIDQKKAIEAYQETMEILKSCYNCSYATPSKKYPGKLKCWNYAYIAKKRWVGEAPPVQTKSQDDCSPCLNYEAKPLTN